MNEPIRTIDWLRAFVKTQTRPVVRVPQDRMEAWLDVTEKLHERVKELETVLTRVLAAESNYARQDGHALRTERARNLLRRVSGEARKVLWREDSNDG